MKRDDVNHSGGVLRTIPVFAVPNVVFFPKVYLPLHIFEPRYRQMVKDSYAGHRLIGMALLRGDWQKDYEGNPDIYPAGCVGEIVRIAPFSDGRYNIILYGLREYEIKEHILGSTPYRQAKVFLREPLGGGALSPSVKREILDLVRQTIEGEESELLTRLRDPSLDEESWLNLCCFALEMSMLEKQSLLEASFPQERAASLLKVLQFQVLEKRGMPFQGAGEPKERKSFH